MRWLFLTIALVFASALSQAPNSNETGQSAERTKPSTSSQETTEAVPPEKKGSTFGNGVTVSEQSKHGGDLGGWASKFLEINLTDVLLAVFTFLLWRSTRALWRSTENLWGEAKLARSVSEKAANAARDAADATKQAFIAAHRPRLVVRQVSIETDGTIQYFIYNVGDSPAKIIEISEGDSHPGESDNLSPLPPYSDSLMVSETLKSGEWMGRRFLSRDPEELFFRRGAGSMRNIAPPVILVLGFIYYEDDLGTRRGTSFLRRFDHRTGRFSAIADPDYEYQD